MVVLDQVDGIAVALLRQRGRERAIHLHELMPDRLGRFVEDRRPGGIPQVVVEEPQDPVGHLVVVRVVPLRWHQDEPDTLTGLRIELVTLDRDLTISLGHRGRHPRRLVAEEHPGALRPTAPAGR